MLFDLHPKESPGDLFGRDSELQNLVDLVKAGTWVAVVGPRMVGKSSLLKTSVVLMEDGMRSVYLSLWGVKGFGGFLLRLLEAINRSKSLLRRVKDALASIEELSLTATGFTVRISRRPMSTASSVLSTLGRLGGRVVIVLDEVQELSGISHTFLKLLANIFNTYPNVVFLFSGSMFGLMRTLLEPSSSSPLYGRSPARLVLKPFDDGRSLAFLKAGFEELGMRLPDEQLEEVVKELNGIVGWLTLYGNNVAIKRMSHSEALRSTFREGTKIVAEELKHFLEQRNREMYTMALKVVAGGASWSEVKHSLEARLGTSVNDATIKNMMDTLLASMLARKEDKRYCLIDPMLKRLLLRERLV